MKQLLIVLLSLFLTSPCWAEGAKKEPRGKVIYESKQLLITMLYEDMEYSPTLMAWYETVYKVPVRDDNNRIIKPVAHKRLTRYVFNCDSRPPTLKEDADIFYSIKGSILEQHGGSPARLALPESMESYILKWSCEYYKYMMSFITK